MNLYGKFEENGYKLEAYMPSNETEKQAFYLKITRDEELVREEYVPMDYAPIFGPDVIDVNKLEARVDKILKEFGGGI